MLGWHGSPQLLDGEVVNVTVLGPINLLALCLAPSFLPRVLEQYGLLLVLVG